MSNIKRVLFKSIIMQLKYDGYLNINKSKFCIVIIEKPYDSLNYLVVCMFYLKKTNLETHLNRIS